MALRPARPGGDRARRRVPLAQRGRRDPGARTAASPPPRDPVTPGQGLRRRGRGRGGGPVASQPSRQPARPRPAGPRPDRPRMPRPRLPPLRRPRASPVPHPTAPTTASRSTSWPRCASATPNGGVADALAAATCRASTRRRRRPCRSRSSRSTRATTCRRPRSTRTRTTRRSRRTTPQLADQPGGEVDAAHPEASVDVAEEAPAAETPVVAPDVASTAEPTPEPTPEPTTEPTAEPTDREPTAEPTTEPDHRARTAAGGVRAADAAPAP